MEKHSLARLTEEKKAQPGGERWARRDAVNEDEFINLQDGLLDVVVLGEV